jgi:sugar lactone lactonase YvrE
VDYTATIVLEGLMMPECPRWHDDTLWFSDMYAGVVLRLRPDGDTDLVVRVQGPGGLGWLPDGTLLFTSIRNRKLMRLTDAVAETAADLSDLESVGVNDLVVDAQGRAYLGGEGFDIDSGAEFAPGSVILVQPDGAASILARDLRYPNGMVITPDGRTFIVAETMGGCLTAFDIASNGSLSNRRLWAQLPTAPDGICLDAEGAVWVACPMSGECLRVREGGEITDKVKAAGKRMALACMLGGADGRTLYLCTCEATGADMAHYSAKGWIESVHVEAPHAGLP